MLSNPKLSEDFVKNYGIETFEQPRQYIEEHIKTADDMDTVIQTKWQRLQDLKELAEVYSEHSRLRKVVKESRSQSIFTKKKFDKVHEAELSDFDYYDAKLSELMGDGKATPKGWAKDMERIEANERRAAERQQPQRKKQQELS